MDGFDDHAALMKALIQQLEEVERPFYEQQATYNYFAWRAVSMIAIAISLAYR